MPVSDVRPNVTVAALSGPLLYPPMSILSSPLMCILGFGLKHVKSRKPCASEINECKIRNMGLLYDN